MDSMQGLNEQQRRAVEVNDGPVLIVAGPGTGKTKTLTSRIVHLQQSGVKPSRILALTFTVKAAREMQTRVQAMVGSVNVPRISTIHSLGYQVLREALPEAELTFISEADRQMLIRELPRSQALRTLPVREVALLISKAKGQVDEGKQDPSVKALLQSYQEALARNGLFDYDDLMYRARQYLAEQEELRHNWRSRFDHVLIDEFQDTSELQWELICSIRSNDNLFVIGDPKQSIYGFRGASALMFERFQRDFPAAQEVTLTVNYRSDVSIVHLASAIFGGKDALVPHATASGSVRVLQTLNEYSEADLVLSLIEEGIGGSDLLKAQAESCGRLLGDFAVLYRTHQVAKALQRRLHDAGIPFQVVGEDSPYEQRDVQAVIGALKWLAGGPLPDVKGFTPGQTKAILGGIDREQPVSKLAEAFAQDFNLMSDSASRQRIAQFAGTLVRYDAREDGLKACLEYIEHLAEGNFYDPDAGAVTLLTIHASKGLEFSHVMLIAAEEGSLPHVRKTLPTDFDEEKRLFYVAATRARHQLDIMYAQKRGGEARQPSRFIAELPEAVLPRHIDPHMARLQKKLQRREQKARQATLF